MKRSVAIFLACAYGAASLPTAKSGCVDSSHCNVGYYCNTEHYTCDKCLQCDDLERAPLPVVSSCVTSIAECGKCLPGLVDDPSGNLNAPCVAEDSIAGARSYVWITLGAVALVVVLLAGVLLYLLRRTDTFKTVSFRTSIQSPCPRRADPELCAPPPPYNASAAFLPLRPTSPPPDQPFAPAHSALKEESSRPFIKRAESGCVRAPRERDSNQEAQVFNNPHYVRGPELPPSYDSSVNVGGGSPELLSEETMESLWSPAEDNNNNTGENNASFPAVGSAGQQQLSALLSEARGTTLVRAPDAAEPAVTEATPSKLLCVRQNSNGNRLGRAESVEGAAGSGGAPPPAPPAGAPAPPPPAPQPPTLSFNITVQQHNDVKLISA